MKYLLPSSNRDGLLILSKKIPGGYYYASSIHTKEVLNSSECVPYQGMVAAAANCYKDWITLNHMWRSAAKAMQKWINHYKYFKKVVLFMVSH